MIVGIDPGEQGGVAFINKKGNITYHSMPFENGEIDCNRLISLLKDKRIDYIFIERQQSKSKQGVKSTFTTGLRYGLLLGICHTLHPDKVIIYTPQQWQSLIKDYPIDIRVSSTCRKDTKPSKLRAISYCINELNITPQTTRGRWLDGIADAILIALYGKSLIC